jgi:hypothetical protein
MALEQQAAVAVLAQSELYGSMHALLRVEAEAVLRGRWFARCATDDEIVSFKAGNGLRHLPVLVTEVEAALGNANDVLSRTVTSQWGALSSYEALGFRDAYPPVSRSPPGSRRDCGLVGSCWVQRTTALDVFNTCRFRQEHVRSAIVTAARYVRARPYVRQHGPTERGTRCRNPGWTSPLPRRVLRDHHRYGCWPASITATRVRT